MEVNQVFNQICQYADTGSSGSYLKPAILGMNIFSKLGMQQHALMTQCILTKEGWNPKYSNLEMFKDSYDWYINNRDTVLNSNGALIRVQSSF